jgi:hypothetical protein
MQVNDPSFCAASGMKLSGFRETRENHGIDHRYFEPSRLTY